MTKINKIIGILKSSYPVPRCALNHSAPHELLIATRLSAQCTDKRVNATTPDLFGRFRTIHDFAAAEVADIEHIVKPCGLYKTKAADIKAMCRILLEKHDGVIPNTMESLLELPGVGRKTANLILGELYGLPAVVADTHVIRLSNRLGLAESKDAYKVEMALLKQIPPSESLSFCHRLVLHGRAVCKARNPACIECELRSLCNTKL
jgi:endonuclease-3